MNQQAFFPGQFYLNSPPGNIGNQSGLMLNCHILLPAKAAAYKHIFHDHFLRRKPKKDGGFVTGIICTLICGIDQHAIIKGHGNGALRL